MTTALAELQRQMRAWLVEADPDALAALGGGPGLGVYQNNYRVALMDTLKETFRRTHSWLGDERFEAAAVHHIDAHPPHSFTLDAYGVDFPATLALLWPDEPDLAEIAGLDWAVSTAFVGPDAVPLDAAALASVDWDTAAIGLVPTLVTLALNTNADALWLALAREETPPPLAEAPGTLLLWRQGFEPVMRRAIDEDLAVLARTLAGDTFAETCAALAETLGEEAAVSMAGTVLGRWLGEGLVASFA